MINNQQPELNPAQEKLSELMSDLDCVLISKEQKIILKNINFFIKGCETLIDTESVESNFDEVRTFIFKTKEYINEVLDCDETTSCLENILSDVDELEHDYSMIEACDNLDCVISNLLISMRKIKYHPELYLRNDKGFDFSLFIDSPCNDAMLTVRARRVILRMGLRSLEELNKKFNGNIEIDLLLEQQNCHRKTIIEIHRALLALGFNGVQGIEKFKGYMTAQ